MKRILFGPESPDTFRSSMRELEEAIWPGINKVDLKAVGEAFADIGKFQETMQKLIQSIKQAHQDGKLKDRSSDSLYQEIDMLWKHLSAIKDVQFAEEDEDGRHPNPVGREERAWVNKVTSFRNDQVKEWIEKAETVIRRIAP